MRAALPTDLLWLLMEASDGQLSWVKRELTRMLAGKGQKRENEPVIRYLIREERTRRRNGKFDRTWISTWRIWFDGEEILMPTLLATEYLVFLIRHQRTSFSAAQLTEFIRKNAATDTTDGQSWEILHGDDGGDEDAGGATDQRGHVGVLTEPDFVLNKDQIASLKKHIYSLQQEIEAHEDAKDFGSARYLKLKDDLEKSQETLKHNTKQVNGEHLPLAYQPGTDQKKADVIRKLFRRLLDTHLKPGCRALFDHLNDRSCLTYGLNNCYSPSPRIPWKFERRKIDS